MISIWKWPTNNFYSERLWIKSYSCLEELEDTPKTTQRTHVSSTSKTQKRDRFSTRLRAVPPHPEQTYHCLCFVSMLPQQHSYQESSFPWTKIWGGNSLDGKENNSGHLEGMSFLKLIYWGMVHIVLSLMRLMAVIQPIRHLWMLQHWHEGLRHQADAVLWGFFLKNELAFTCHPVFMPSSVSPVRNQSHLLWLSYNEQIIAIYNPKLNWLIIVLEVR